MMRAPRLGARHAERDAADVEVVPDGRGGRDGARKRQVGGRPGPVRELGPRLRKPQATRGDRLAGIERAQRIGLFVPDRPGHQHRLLPFLHQGHGMDPNRRVQLDGAGQRERVEPRVAVDVARHHPGPSRRRGHPQDLLAADRRAARRRLRAVVVGAVEAAGARADPGGDAIVVQPEPGDRRCRADRRRSPSDARHSERGRPGHPPRRPGSSPAAAAPARRRRPASRPSDSAAPLLRRRSCRRPSRPVSSAVATQALPSSSTAIAVSACVPLASPSPTTS